MVEDIPGKEANSSGLNLVNKFTQRGTSVLHIFRFVTELESCGTVDGAGRGGIIV